MDLISKERDRLLQRSARVYGLSFTAVSALCFALPGAVPFPVLLLGVPLYLVLAAALVAVGMNRSIWWPVVALVSGTGLVLLVGLVATPPTPTASLAIIHVAAAGLASLALVLTTSVPRIALLVVGALGGVAAVVLAEIDSPAQALRSGGTVLVGWGLAALITVWINAGVPQVAKRIASIGRAHRAERQASELEAQRRQGARLLHDTVLASLTLLAHSGVGVKPEALRQQAAEDARLLRQLRLGQMPAVPTETGTIPVVNPDETVLGTTLESVKQRFGRMGLTVAWHGTGQVLLPSEVLDAFLMALAECLENVRRHSGVTEAHVTITDDDKMVRALVTDAGVGFNIDDIDEAKLGFAESVVGRLREVGGNARLFSAPGSGTTVALEVPRG
ncbi:sensor histidine kinase [Pseudolysinimonas sp.]|jgi:signal transduction histidine kinase|uniref:sensor histidine kinase n=1 Tax=Pseudolysinimonas sp. TaxID=2680009 RepID=UPI003783FE9F